MEKFAIGQKREILKNTDADTSLGRKFKLSTKKKDCGLKMK